MRSYAHHPLVHGYGVWLRFPGGLSFEGHIGFLTFAVQVRVYLGTLGMAILVADRFRAVMCFAFARALGAVYQRGFGLFLLAAVEAPP